MCLSARPQVKPEWNCCPDAYCFLPPEGLHTESHSIQGFKQLSGPAVFRDDLNGVLGCLRDEGVAVDPKRENYDFGKFGWFTDPEGNRVELWQPVAPG